LIIYEQCPTQSLIIYEQCPTQFRHFLVAYCMGVENLRSIL